MLVRLATLVLIGLAGAPIASRAESPKQCAHPRDAGVGIEGFARQASDACDPKRLPDEKYQTPTHVMNLERETLASGKTFAGTPVPAAVTKLLQTARAKKAAIYDPSDLDGEWSAYAPSLIQDEGNMAFPETEVTPAGAVAHPGKWANNCGFLADGSLHCLPASRQASRYNDGEDEYILTNPDLARNKARMLYNGHISFNGDVVVGVEMSGHLVKKLSNGQRFIDPIAFLKAWGFKVSPGVKLELDTGDVTRRPFSLRDVKTEAGTMSVPRKK